MSASFPATQPTFDALQAVIARALARGIDGAAVAREARRVARAARTRVLPAFVARQLTLLDGLARLADDPAATPLPEPKRAQLLGALAYVSEPDDVIPDATPEIGLWDDAVVIDLVARELHAELAADAARCRGHAHARRAMRGRMERRREQRSRRGGLFAMR